MAKSEVHVYCDESCHLENDKNDFLVIGCVYCSTGHVEKIKQDIRDIRKRHGVNEFQEIKWGKASPAKKDLYLELINYFIYSPHLNYRGILALNKNSLDHEMFNNGSYLVWVGKMYYLMLKQVLVKHPNRKHQILIDISDKYGSGRNELLRRLFNDLDKNISIDQAESYSSSIMQIADMLNGAIAYNSRKLQHNNNANQAKIEIVDLLSKRYSLDESSPLSNDKFNLFIWRPQGGNIDAASY